MPVLSLISRNSPKQLGMVSPELLGNGYFSSHGNVLDDIGPLAVKFIVASFVEKLQERLDE